MNNWPTHKGPRSTLAALGLIDPESRLDWTRRSSFRDYADGTMYLTHPNFIRTDGIRHLAALSFEGYETRIGVHDKSLTVSLYGRSINND